jgi:hypothetical protein
MKIEHPDSHSVNKLQDMFLWKFLDLFKLLDIISSRELYFTRFDNFEDGLEGLTGKAIGLMAFTQGIPLTMENVNKSPDIETQRKIVKEDQHKRKELDEIINGSQKTQFASCWFLGDRESLAMWKIYSKKEGVALKFRAKQLTETIIASASSYTNSDFKKFYYGKVDYKNIWPFDPHEDYPGKFNGLKKDRSYIHENEYRFVAVVPSSKQGQISYLKLPIGDLKYFDVEIITNPFMETWQFDALRNTLVKHNLDSKLIASNMKVKKSV